MLIVINLSLKKFELQYSLSVLNTIIVLNVKYFFHGYDKCEINNKLYYFKKIK